MKEIEIDNRNITLEEIKNIGIGILEQIDNICKENNLKYSLLGGSLLGAIRHQGFIPWDDDIDIMMPRPDYEKLKEIMIEHPIEKIKYMSCDTQPDYYYPYAKVVSTITTAKEYNLFQIQDYGVFIDIFPIDGTYDSEIKRWFQKKKINILRFLMRSSYCEKQLSNSIIKKIIKKIIAFFTKLIGFKRWTKIMQKTMQKCDYAKSKYASLVEEDIYIKDGKFYTKDMFENVSLKPFENKKFYVIDNYDKFLTDEFGDYMTLPPIEKQKSNHHFDRLMWKK